MDAEFATKLREQFSPREKYLIGVSGGRDSMALWHYLRGVGYENLVVCHLNHQLRGSDSEEDAEFVRAMAGEWRSDALIGSANVSAIAEERKLSIETAAREARHEFFAESAQKAGSVAIFLGHHADDQVETVVMNLSRGCGLRGLAGMLLKNQVTVEGTQLCLIRPYLEIWRTEIEDYVRRHGIAFRDDATNAETSASTRNRVRHELIPLMQEIFDRDVRKAIHRISRIAGSHEMVEDLLLRDLLPRLLTLDKEGLDVRSLMGMERMLQHRILYRWLRKEHRLPACGHREIEAICSIISPEEKTAKVNLPGGWHARRSRGRLFLQPPPKD